jgi:bisphosphoglycerate-dependent phosphoglycerate mutase
MAEIIDLEAARRARELLKAKTEAAKQETLSQEAERRLRQKGFGSFKGTEKSTDKPQAGDDFWGEGQ